MEVFMFYKRIDIPVIYSKIETVHDDYQPFLECYIHKQTPEINRGCRRPAVIICPGGAYYFKSEREAEPVALRYLAYGMNTFILQYSVKPNKYPCAMLELAEAVRTVRAHSEEWDIDPQKIIICGFSAGGHVCASLGTKWDSMLLKKYFGEETAPASWKPDGMILCYPVITMGEYTHKESKENLIGDTSYTAEETSLENSISKHTVPAFVWHTFEDTAVPAENSLIFCMGLKKMGIPFELHIYEAGEHGLSLCDRETLDQAYQLQPDNENWLKMSVNWINRLGSRL